MQAVAGTQPRRAGDRLAASYANFYVANPRVVFALLDERHDDEAAAVLRDCFPEREIVGVPATRDPARRRQHPLHHARGARGRVRALTAPMTGTALPTANC